MQSTSQNECQRRSGNYTGFTLSNQHDADLVLSALRHQRDLFSGQSPGIPDVNTHVGSVIHAFETLAHQRTLVEANESSKSNSSTGKKEFFPKIILPPSTKISTGTLTDPVKKIVRPRPKSKAPDIPTASATTQTTKTSADENDSSNMDSLNMDEDFRRATFGDDNTTNIKKFPQSYIKTYKISPPFVPPRQQSKIPTKFTKISNKSNNQNMSRNRLADNSQKSRTDVFLKSNYKYSEDDIENDFLRGSTVSQSFIKNVIRKSPTRKMSTYEQNFLLNEQSINNNNKRDRSSMDRNSRDRRSRSTSSKLESPKIDEVSLRYKEYNSNNDLTSLRNNSRPQNFQPRTSDRAEI